MTAAFLLGNCFAGIVLETIVELLFAGFDGELQLKERIARRMNSFLSF
jgi:hypothetical protein